MPTAAKATQTFLATVLLSDIVDSTRTAAALGLLTKLPPQRTSGCTLRAMTRVLTITEARELLLTLPDETDEEPVVVTRRGRPVLTILNHEHFEALLETLEILDDRQFLAELREGIRQIDADQTIPLTKIKEKLGL